MSTPTIPPAGTRRSQWFITDRLQIGTGYICLCIGVGLLIDIVVLLSGYFSSPAPLTVAGFIELTVAQLVFFWLTPCVTYAVGAVFWCGRFNRFAGPVSPESAHPEPVSTLVQTL